ncbi:MAG: segregation/condensation protein A [Candidatus Micrarchaeota archaeon]|nr:segregation/condensation protein A [Candidatus Micrarchaeota archaeon]
MTSGAEVTAFGSGLNLQEFVKNATWRELLMELVDTNRLDPWDIDIAKVVDSYIAAVRKMQIMDLHIPANIMLASSILLRMKSETVNILHEEETLEPEEELQTFRTIPDVPMLVPRLRLQPKRKITLGELMDALGDAMKVTEKRQSVVRQRAEPINLVIEREDIDEKMHGTLNLVRESMDREGITTFAMLSKGYSSIESILLGLFVPLLFLAHRGDVTLMQDEFFKEIFVKLNGDSDGKGKQ